MEHSFLVKSQMRNMLDVAQPSELSFNPVFYVLSQCVFSCGSRLEGLCVSRACAAHSGVAASASILEQSLEGKKYQAGVS